MRPIGMPRNESVSFPCGLTVFLATFTAFAGFFIGCYGFKETMIAQIEMATTANVKPRNSLVVRARFMAV